jgi:ADP-ribose pyrophosphatase YjhB (NUDIX family)
MDPSWLRWARGLQAIAQNGLTYATDVYDQERYQAVREVAAEMMAARAGTDTESVLDLFAKETGYATPKVDVRGAVFRDEGILLVREASDGRWSLPGGWADVNDSPSENIVREIAEESGFETRVRKLAAVLDRGRHPHVPIGPHHVYKMFFICEIVGGAPKPNHEIHDVGFFGADDLPELSLDRVLPAQIDRMFDHWRQPDLPTEFD